MNEYLQFSTKSIAKVISYLFLECKECHIQYVGKAETNFKLKLNSHLKDVYKAGAISASPPFAMKDDIFNRGASFNKIKQIHKST